MPTLLHVPGCNFGEWQGVSCSCAVLGGFAIGARVLLLWRHTRLMRNVSECSLFALWLAFVLLTCSLITGIQERIYLACLYCLVYCSFFLAIDCVLCIANGRPFIHSFIPQFALRFSFLPKDWFPSTTLHSLNDRITVSYTHLTLPTKRIV